MTSEVILHFMKYLRLYNVRVHINFDQNQFRNEYARKIKAKISESRSPGDTEFFSGIYVEEVTFLINIGSVNR